MTLPVRLGTLNESSMNGIRLGLTTKQVIGKRNMSSKINQRIGKTLTGVTNKADTQGTQGREVTICGSSFKVKCLQRQMLRGTKLQ
jgi:hypothetical protein